MRVHVHVVDRRRWFFSSLHSQNDIFERFWYFSFFIVLIKFQYARRLQRFYGGQVLMHFKTWLSYAVFQVSVWSSTCLVCRKSNLSTHSNIPFVEFLRILLAIYLYKYHLTQFSFCLWWCDNKILNIVATQCCKGAFKTIFR